MKDYKNACGCFFQGSPSRCLSVYIWGGCKFGYKGFNFLCSKCKNYVKPYKINNSEEAKQNGKQ